MIRRLKRLARSGATSAVHVAMRSARLRALVSAELRGRPVAPAAAPVDVRPAGEFVDRYGVRHPLDWALRDSLKPGWRIMCDPEAATRPPTDEALAGRARKADKLVAEASALVATLTGRSLGGRILEVGCYDGAIAFQLAKRDGTDVVASDMARYYIVQRPGDLDPTDLASQQRDLDVLRERARLAAGTAPGRVAFVEDDITSSTLEPGTFDAIISVEVLEHLQRPVAAFASMAALLKPGGVGYHDYNPFFSLIGGHSLCTLDFPWGHARLDAADVERYLTEIRPEAREQSLRFYVESLNRMTFADLRVAVEAAGLELLGVVPWSDRTLIGRLESEVVSEVRRTYPTAEAEDLLATYASVIVRRPG